MKIITVIRFLTNPTTFSFGNLCHQNANSGRSSENGDDLQVMTVVHDYQKQRLLKISLAVTMVKIVEAAVIDTVDDLVNIHNNEQLVPCQLFNAMLKCIRYCHFIMEDDIKNASNASSKWNSKGCMS